MPRQLVKIAVIKDGIFKEFNPNAEIPDGWGVFRYFYKDTETGETMSSTMEDVEIAELHALKQNIPRIIKGYLEEFEGKVIDSYCSPRVFITLDKYYFYTHSFPLIFHISFIKKIL